jgi:multicomponent Na+:H+ antiporter subunit B
MKGMTVIVKKVTQITAGLIFMYSFYIILQGHLSPGGGFAGGTILAGTFVLLVIAFGADAGVLQLRKTRAGLTEALGILLFIITAMGALLISYKLDMLPAFMLNFLDKGTPGELISAGYIPLLNIFIGLEVGGALLVIFLEFVIRSKEGKEK